MSNSEKLHELKIMASSITLLYVEDNKGLSAQASNLFRKFFKEVYVAENGEEGLELFKKYKPKMVITDIKMPKMDGITMAKAIYKIEPDIKIIIASACESAECLVEAVNIGIYRYLEKPIAVTALTDVLYEALKESKEKEYKQLFDFYIHNIFHNEESLLILYKNETPLVINNAFGDFFHIDTIEEFEDKYNNLGELFLEHKGFLYNKKGSDCFAQAKENTNKLYNVKLLDHDGEFHHFIFKITPIHNYDNYYLVSMDDITDFGILKLYEENINEGQEVSQDNSALLKLLETVKRNKAEIKMYNLYKGVTIVNKSSINVVEEGNIELKAPFLQQKAALFEKQTILTCELFPLDIMCKEIKKVNFDEQTIIVDNLVFVDDSNLKRDSVRLEPEENHLVTLLYQHHQFSEGIKIIDVSRDAVKLSLLALPSGIEEGSELNVEMVYKATNKPIVINSAGRVKVIKKEKNEWIVLVLLEPTKSTKKILIDYLAKRQMALIREFKGLAYET